MDKVNGTNHDKYFTRLAIIFYAITLISNSAAHKIIDFYGFYISTATILYPLSYPLLAAITELYGFKKAKQIIITTALCNFGCAAYLYLVGLITGAPYWIARYHGLTHLYTLHISLIFFVSTIAFIASEYANSFIIAKLKALTSGNFFVLRAFTAITTAIILDSIFMLRIRSINYIF